MLVIKFRGRASTRLAARWVSANTQWDLQRMHTHSHTHMSVFIKTFKIPSWGPKRLKLTLTLTHALRARECGRERLRVATVPYILVRCRHVYSLFVIRLFVYSFIRNPIRESTQGTPRLPMSISSCFCREYPIVLACECEWLCEYPSEWVWVSTPIRAHTQLIQYACAS